MSGIYVDFPPLPHHVEGYKHETPRELLVEALAEALTQINGFSSDRMISVAGRDGIFKGNMRLQVGVGSGHKIYYYRSNRALKRTIVKALKVLRQPFIDLGIRASYKYFNGKRWQPVRADEYLVRIFIEEDKLSFQLKLIRGLGRLDPKDLVNLIIERVKISLRNLGIENPMLVKIGD